MATEGKKRTNCEDEGPPMPGAPVHVYPPWDVSDDRGLALVLVPEATAIDSLVLVTDEGGPRVTVYFHHWLHRVP